MIETMANGYSSESARRELSNEYQLDSVNKDSFQHFLHFSPMGESSLSIGRVKIFYSDRKVLILVFTSYNHKSFLLST